MAENRDQFKADEKQTGTTSSVMTQDDRFVGMFSYGSNNEQQLRARVKSPNLRGYPAYLDGYVRVFGFDSPPVGWGGGSVASIAPKEGGRVYGCFYLMTPKEVAILDLYEHVKEGGYLKEAVMVNVKASPSTPAHTAGEPDKDGARSSAESASSVKDNGDFVMTSAVTYIMSQQFVQTFVQPSPQYLTAVHRTLTVSFPELLESPVGVCDYTGTKRSEWTYPGSKNLPLKAFLLEVGLQEQPPWTLPYSLNPIASRLEAAGIGTTEELCQAAIDGILLTRWQQSTASTHSSESVAAATRGGSYSKQAQAEKQDPSSTPLPTSATTTLIPASGETESYRKLASSTAVPELSQNTVDIIVRLANSS